MIIIGNDHSGIFYFKIFFHKQLMMKNLGHLSSFLGLEVSPNSISYYLSQAKYNSHLLSHADLTDTKIVSIPLKTNVRLTPLDSTPLSDSTLYRQLVGGLVYFTVTRLKIAHSVHLVSHSWLLLILYTMMQLMLHILRYIMGMMFHGFHFSAHSSLDLCTYYDAAWA